jgi:hypothetical protein
MTPLCGLALLPLWLLFAAVAIGVYPLVKKGIEDLVHEHKIGTEIFVTIATLIALMSTVATLARELAMSRAAFPKRLAEAPRFGRSQQRFCAHGLSQRLILSVAATEVNLPNTGRVHFAIASGLRTHVVLPSKAFGLNHLLTKPTRHQPVKKTA